MYMPKPNKSFVEAVDLANFVTEPLDGAADAADPVVDNDPTTCVSITTLKQNIRDSSMQHYLLKIYILPESGTVGDGFTVQVRITISYCSLFKNC